MRDPHVPSKLLLLPKKDSRSQEKLHFWGRDCRAKRALDSWDHRVPKCPAKPPAATAMEGSVATRWER